MHIIIALLGITALLFGIAMLVGRFIRVGSGEPEPYGPDPMSVLLRAYDGEDGQ